MDGPITFDRELRTEVFDFFTNILQDFPDPVYYEYIRGHVSKASLPVRRYVASKCKGEKLLEYFKLRKNYFSVKGTDVLLIRDPCQKRKRVQSECAGNVASRGRKYSWRSDKGNYKRSVSCSSVIGDNTVISSNDVQLEHEDYVNKFFCDLVIRHEKVDISSLKFDELPKKVRRHLQLYYNRKVANYFAQFPDKYVIDDEWKVSFNLHLPENIFANTKTKSVDPIPSPDSANDDLDPIPSPDSANDDSLLIRPRKKSPDLNESEIRLILCHTDAILFFMAILTKKKTAVTIQQLGGYLSQAPKELISFFKFNFKSFKNFFEETSDIFLLNSQEEVTLSKFSRHHKSGLKLIRKIVLSALIGDMSLQTMWEKVEEVRNKIKTFVLEKESDNRNKGDCKVIDETLPVDDTVPQITEDQPESPVINKTIEVDSSEPIGTDEEMNEQTDASKSLICSDAIEVDSSEPIGTDEEMNEQTDASKSLICSEAIEVANSEPNCTDINDEKINEHTYAATMNYHYKVNMLPGMAYDVSDIIKRLKIDYEFYGISTVDIVFEINGNLYEPNGNPYDGKAKLCGNQCTNCDHCADGWGTNENDTIDENSKIIVRVIPTPCTEHEKFLSEKISSECNIDPHLNMACPKQKQEEKVFKFLLMIELFCLEITEKDFDYTVSNEVNAIQYFIEMLDQPIEKSWDVRNLHGTLGKATVEVSSFIKRKYKASNFLSFFQKQPEFEVYPPIVKLSASYKETFTRRINTLSMSVNRNSKWDLLKLYGSGCYKNILIEILALFSEICHFLINKSRVKLSRLEGIVTRFPNCLDWIKALEGDTLAKKTSNFLLLFDIFEFPSDSYISFQFNYVNSLLMTRIENAHSYFDNPNQKVVLGSIFHQVKEGPPDKQSDVVNAEHLSCDFIKEAVKGKMPLKYHELAGTIPEDLLMEVIDNYIGSRSLIEALLKDGQYFLQNGKIDFKKHENNSVNLESAIDNSLNKNKNFQSSEEPSNKTNEVDSKTSNGLVSNNQTCDKTNPDYCNKSKNASSNDFPLVSSIGENVHQSNPIDLSSIPISVKSQNYSNDYNQNNPQLLYSECVNHSSQTTVSKEVKEINNSVNLESAIDNSLNKNQNFQSPGKPSDKTNEVDSKTSNGSVSNNQTCEKTNPDDCNKSKNTSSNDVPLVSSIGENVHQSMPIDISAIPTSVKSQNDSNDYNQNNPQLLDSECVNYNSQTTVSKEVKEIISVDSKEDSKDMPLNEDFKINEDSNTKSSDGSFGVVRCETWNQGPHDNAIENEDDFDSEIEEIDSLIALGERYSLSSFENEASIYSDEENSHGFIEQDTSKCAADPRYEKDCISTQFIDVCEKEKPEDIEDETMKKYLEFLNLDDEFHVNYVDSHTNENDASFNGNGSNEALSLSKVPFASDLIDSETNVDLSDEHKVAEVSKKDFPNQTDFTHNIENKNMSENISEMKYKAEPLAEEVLPEKYHEKSTVDKDLNHNTDTSAVTFQDKPVSTNNATVDTQVNLNDCTNFLVEYPLQEKLNSANNMEKSASFSSDDGNECHVDSPYLEEVDSKYNLKSNENLKSSDCQSVPKEYPLQPISAEIVLLTSDSCIAVAEIDFSKQNIYFLKCVFVCDDHNCCSNCFDDLRVGDTVSCFVPPTEISRKMWIAFMVSKESGSHFNEIDTFNEVITRQNKGGSMIHNMCVNSKNVLVQTENSSAKFGCQIKSMSTEQSSQTSLSGDVKLCAITEDSMCQINPLVNSAFTQAVSETNSSECQTEFASDTIEAESQTNHTGELKEVSISAELSCQTDLTGEVRATINVVDTECQTISTGQVMITKYYHHL